MGAPYLKAPVVIVFKTSNRTNAKVKMKVFKNKNIDIVNGTKLPGIPDTSVVLELSIGEMFIDRYKKKYKL